MSAAESERRNAATRLPLQEKAKAPRPFAGSGGSPEPPETIVINRAEGSARRDGQRRVTWEASDFNRPTN